MESSESSRLDAARQEFEKELSLNPRDAVAEYQVAQILQVKGDPAAAGRFERALSLKPDFVEAMVALAKLDQGRAIPLLERAVGIQPSNEAARYQLVLAYRNAGRPADAERAKTELDKLQRPPEGEFSDFLKRIGGKKPQ
jgi:tetratricopeptide (TPR) repeat protein